MLPAKKIEELQKWNQKIIVSIRRIEWKGIFCSFAHWIIVNAFSALLTLSDRVVKME